VLGLGDGFVGFMFLVVDQMDEVNGLVGGGALYDHEVEFVIHGNKLIDEEAQGTAGYCHGWFCGMVGLGCDGPGFYVQG